MRPRLRLDHLVFAFSENVAHDMQILIEQHSRAQRPSSAAT
jgi:hypothetical protein